MAEISPFRGIHYDTGRVGELADVIAPPYDVIDSAEQTALYARSPYNFVRVMLNRAEPDDAPGHDAYSRAAACLREWVASGALVEDDAPALYAYRQEFTNPADARRYTRTGLFAALKLEPYSAGIVLPHEETRTRAKEDRLRLMRATESNPEPIFGLYDDPDRRVAAVLDSACAATPMLDATVGGDRHAVWRLTDPEAVTALQSAFADRRVWIADGHHRYETALAYRDERRRIEPRRSEEAKGKQGGCEAGSTAATFLPNTEHPIPEHRTPNTEHRAPSDYILIVLTAFDDPGIVVLPTHRLVKNVPQARLDQLYLQLERYFTVEPVHPERLAAAMDNAGDPAVHRFGVAQRDRAWVATLRDSSVMDAAVEDYSARWKRLDVSILQTLVLDRSLGIPAATLATTPDVGYTRDRREAFELVRSGQYQLALLLNNPSADEVRDVAAAGDKMPPKSTFFYPKLWSGLLLRRL